MSRNSCSQARRAYCRREPVQIREVKVAVDQERHETNNLPPEEAPQEGKKVHLATLMDLCLLPKSIWTRNSRSTKGAVVLRDDAVKDG